AIVNVLPPNQSPTASILISPESLGGLTPQYYWTSVLTFSSSSNDPDGNIVAYKWYYDGVLTSEDSQFSLSFTSADIGLHQIKLEVQDNDGVWSSQTATGFKLKDNNEPTCDWYPEENNGTYLLISDCEDPDEEGFIVEYFWTAYANIDGDNVIIFNATGRNLTFTPTFSSDYVFTLVATDNGGLSSSAAGHSIDVKLDLPKNFIVSFGSKEIDVGDFFHIDFSETTGEYSYFKVKVTSPNGTTKDYQVNDISSNFTIGFNEAGTYPIDVQVVWADGTDRGLDDFYGPTVTVGSKAESSTGDSNESVDLAEESDDLPSLSLLFSTLILSLIAVSRRQR
ncbi:MAG: PKD domain-containing protein, partial [Candidatus Thermoplasmatota archaeon]|nr:PKD domain-containing protein [Candidatus Thermoplasmatota archaeon]